jgi:hypothetical protein
LNELPLKLILLEEGAEPLYRTVYTGCGVKDGAVSKVKL